MKKLLYAIGGKVSPNGEIVSDNRPKSIMGVAGAKNITLTDNEISFLTMYARWGCEVKISIKHEERSYDSKEKFIFSLIKIPSASEEKTVFMMETYSFSLVERIFLMLDLDMHSFLWDNN